ncbi:hypothetical protein [Amycolatopsis sp. lyj-346]|uniref:hypothetical protein n=1 Tax=Amycolatopsis sp. lyj-346 TaxID=2789289 RepID=UPI0039789822
MKTFVAALVVLSIATFVAGAVLLSASNVDVPAEVGKWLLTLGTALAVTGALSVAIKLRDERRARQSAWEVRLSTIIAANHSVVVIRLMLRAHKTARAYRDQIAELTRVRAQLRTLHADGAILMSAELLAAVKAMRRYLDAVGQEYEAGYLPVARQQMVDERRMEDAVRDAANESLTTALGEYLMSPTPAWAMLTDPARFPCLVAFLDEESFRASSYRTGYQNAKRLLENRAGITRTALGSSPAIPDL